MPISCRSTRKLALVVACAVVATSTAVAQAQSVDARRLAVEKVVADLIDPTAFVFLGPDEFLIAEKGTGRVRHVRAGRFRSTALDLPVNAEGSRGLLGLELDPEFASNGLVYLFYAEADGGDGRPWTRHVVARYRWDGAKLTQPRELVSFPRSDTQANPSRHNGGILRFGPDGYLYGQVGDLDRGMFDDPRIEQNTDDGASAGVGGIFRLKSNGRVPADNPFADHPLEEVRRWFVYGVRNGFGLAFDPLTDRLWFSENGPTVYDEINVAVSGMNSGWLLLMGPDSRDARYKANGEEAFDEEDLVMLPGASYQDPVFSWLVPIGVTSVVFLRSDTFPPPLQDALLVGDANTGALYLFRPRGSRRTRLRLRRGLADGVADSRGERIRHMWGRSFGVTSDMRMGPDGNLYVLSFSHGVLRRVRPR